MLPTLEQQDALEISEESDFAEGKVYKVSKGDFVRYFNVVPLYQPQEVVLIEMAEVPFTENWPQGPRDRHPPFEFGWDR